MSVAPTPPLPLFYIARTEGSSTGPHHAGYIRKGLASGELSPETPVSLKGTEKWLPLREFTGHLDMPRHRLGGPPCKAELRRGNAACELCGVAFALGTVALSFPASLFLHRGMAAAGFACLLAMAGCLVAAMMLLDPLRR